MSFPPIAPTTRPANMFDAMRPLVGGQRQISAPRQLTKVNKPVIAAKMARPLLRRGK